MGPGHGPERPLGDLTPAEFRDAVHRRKAEARQELAALAFAEKIARLERMRAAAAAIRLARRPR
jgi:hypothetical protein